jgi:hypothetical protein
MMLPPFLVMPDRFPGKRLNQNCRSRVLLVFDDTVVDEADRMRHDPAAPFRTT